MTAKRKRRRSRTSSPASSSKEGRAQVAEKDGARKNEKKRGQPPARLPESPFPPLGTSLARGFLVVGGSPSILATAFLALLGTWGVFVLLGAEAGPRTLSLLLSAPPVHVFSDAPVALSPGSSGLYSVLSVAGLTALRGITFALLGLLIVEGLREGRTSVRSVLGLLPRTAIVIGGLYLVQFGIVVAAFQLLVGFLGQLAVLSIAAGLYFLVFAPVVAAAEGEGPRQALRRGVRAARLPGARHLSMVMAYFLMLFYSGAIAPFGVLAPATPSIGVWAYSLGMTFVHVSVLAAFIYRWLAVRDQVPAAPGPR
ncbi:MAG: hypothetical protein ACRDHM_02460 [Actinomycetota bacterium]